MITKIQVSQFGKYTVSAFRAPLLCVGIAMIMAMIIVQFNSITQIYAASPLMLTTAGATSSGERANASQQDQDQEKAKDQVPESLNFTVESIDGEQVDLKKYAGKVVVVVNVASRCGYTPQYKSLQALYEEHGEQGLVILGFPCNQFRSQEPGSNLEIKEFCLKEYQVTFDMFAKIDVNGANRAPFYEYLTKQELAPAKAGDISWNFEKFVIGRDGKPIARFGSKVRPDSDEFTEVVKKALAQ